MEKHQLLDIPPIPATPAFRDAPKISYLIRIAHPDVTGEELSKFQIAMMDVAGGKRRIRWESANRKIREIMDWDNSHIVKAYNMMESEIWREMSMFAKLDVFASPNNDNTQLTWDVYGSHEELLREKAEAKDPGDPARSTRQGKLRGDKKRNKSDAWKFRNKNHPAYGIPE